MDVRNYLNRIGINQAAVEVNIESLRRLQRSHLLAVPFENLDIHWKRPIKLDLEAFRQKIVDERRGGFCYELNGLFNQLLRELGFQTRLISARVFNGTGHGPEFDHAAIIATVDGTEYLVDVGFGAFTAEPLRFVVEEDQHDANGIFRIRNFGGGYFEVVKYNDGGWHSEYIFKDVEHELSEFAEMCDHQQYSPDSHFTKGKLCSIMTQRGRKTLTDKSFLVTADGAKTETAIASDDDFYSILTREFGIAGRPEAI